MSNELTTLLSPRTATLVYAVPLLIVSVVLTFAGTFLALDRTRSFPQKHVKSDKFIYSSYECFEKRRKRRYFWWWRLEGGVGGLAIGFAFGVHLATLLALMVANISTSAPLSSTAFLTVCIISAILSSLVAGRYRIAAVLFASLSSGALTSMALSVMLHPPLMGRRILLVALTILVAVPTTFVGIVSLHISAAQNNTCLAYLPHFAHPLLRFCTASTGSFSLILSIALLLKPTATSWANVWERLWVSDGEGWQTSREKGLTAAWVFFTCLGILEDWALKKWLGEDPDEKWDDYMSAYVQSLPFSSDRAGTFKPLPSLWDRLFRRRTHSDPGFSDSFKHNPSLTNLDLKLKSLLRDEVSSPLLKPAVPDPFYADTPPPPSHLPPLESQHKSKQDDAILRPGTKPSDPLSDAEEAGCSDDSEDYDLPPFIRKRRKKGRFAGLRLRLFNPDSIESHAGFKPLAQARKNDSQGKDDKKGYLGDGTSTTVSSTTLVNSGVKQNPTRGSDAGTSEGGRSHSQETRTTGDGRTELVPPISTADYSDYEVDLTSMAPSLQGKGRERVLKFMDQPISLATSRTQSQTSNSETSFTEAQTSNPGPSATDRARAKVRAIVAGSSNRPSRRGSLAQMPQIPISPPPVFHGSQSPSPDMGSPPPAAWPASVPATPSLINALHRVAAAQQQAYGVHTVSDNHGVEGLPISSVADADPRPGGLPDIAANRGRNMIRIGSGPREAKRDGAELNGGGWDEFWRDVKVQAGNPNR